MLRNFRHRISSLEHGTPPEHPPTSSDTTQNRMEHSEGILIPFFTEKGTSKNSDSSKIATLFAVFFSTHTQQLTRLRTLEISLATAMDKKNQSQHWFQSTWLVPAKLSPKLTSTRRSSWSITIVKRRHRQYGTQKISTAGYRRRAHVRTYRVLHRKWE